MRQRKLIGSSFILIIIISLLSFSNGAPDGRTGAPGEMTCSQSVCHGNTPDFDGMIEFNGFPAAAVAGQSFQVSVSVVATTGSPARGGFSMVALGNNNGAFIDVGTFSDAGADAVVDFVESTNRTYLSHSPAKNFGSSDRVTYTARWTTPNSFNVDTVKLYAAAVLADGNGGRTGDQVILATMNMPVNIVGDADNDGFNSDLDCDDTDAAINPDADEIPNNDVDENCDGVVLIIDEDDDGFNSDDDCDDRDANISPGEIEIPNNDVDENCDGVIVVIDEDNDGFNSDVDCDDTDPEINPGAVDIPNNNIDENCDGLIVLIDEDDDGFNSDVDCDDSDPLINPDAEEIPNNNVDENCDGFDGAPLTTISAVIVDIQNQPVTNVEIRASENGEVLAITDLQGAFSIQVADNTTVLEFSKEATAANGLSSTDLVIITNHILDRIVFTNQLQERIADVNNSGSVTATDLVLIKRIILQNQPNFERPAWNFEPASVDLQNQTSVDTIVAFKLGDVNVSATN